MEDFAVLKSADVDTGVIHAGAREGALIEGEGSFKIGGAKSRRGVGDRLRGCEAAV